MDALFIDHRTPIFSNHSSLIWALMSTLTSLDQSHLSQNVFWEREIYSIITFVMCKLVRGQKLYLLQRNMFYRERDQQSEYSERNKDQMLNKRTCSIAVCESSPYLSLYCSLKFNWIKSLYLYNKFLISAYVTFNEFQANKHVLCKSSGQIFIQMSMMVITI